MRRALAAIIALGGTLAGAVCAQTAPSNADSVRKPAVSAGNFDRDEVVRAMLDRSRLLDDAHFRVPVELWKQYAREVRAGQLIPPAEPAPVDMIAAEGVYEFHVAPATGKAGVAARITLHVLNPPLSRDAQRIAKKGTGTFSSGENEPVPFSVRVLSTQLIWEHVRVNGQPVKLPEKNGWLVFTPESAGEYVITAEAEDFKLATSSGRANLPVLPTVRTLASIRAGKPVEIAIDGRQVVTSEMAPAAAPAAAPAGIAPTGRGGLDLPIPAFRGALPEGKDSVVLVPLTARDRIAFDWQPPQPVSRRPARYELSGHLAWNLDSAGEEVSARLTVRIVGNTTEQLELSLPPAAERVAITGPDVREVQVRDGAATVHLRGSIAEQTRLDVRFALPARKDQQASLPAIGIANGHWSETAAGSTVVVTNTDGGIVLEGSTRGLRELSLHEIPAAAAALLAGPPALAYEIAARDFAATVELLDLGEQALTESIADLAHFELLLARDGSVLCKAQYEVRNRTRQFLRIDLPPGSRVLMARVNEKPCPVTPIAGAADAVMLPLVRSKASVRGLVSFPVEIVLMTRTGAPGGSQSSNRKSEISNLKSEISLPLPRIDVPVAYAWCETYIPSAMNVTAWSGPMAHVQRYSSETAQAHLGYGAGERAEGLKGLTGPESTAPELPDDRLAATRSGARSLDLPDSGRARGRARWSLGNLFAMGGRAPLPQTLQAKPIERPPNFEGPRIVMAKSGELDGKDINAGLLMARNYWRAGRDFYDTNDYANAETALNKVVEAAPESNEAANARRLLDNIGLARGKLDLKGKSEIAAGATVRQEQQEALKEVSARQHELLTQAERAAAAGKYEQARSQLTVAQSLGEQIVAQGGGTAEQTYRSKQVQAQYKQIAGKESGQVSQLRSQLEMSKKGGDLNKAMQTARQLRNLAPDAAGAAEAQKELEELARTSAQNEAKQRQRDELTQHLRTLTRTSEEIEAEITKIQASEDQIAPAGRRGLEPAETPAARVGGAQAETVILDATKSLDDQVAQLQQAVAAKEMELKEKLASTQRLVAAQPAPAGLAPPEAPSQGRPQGGAQGQAQPQEEQFEMGGRGGFGMARGGGVRRSTFYGAGGGGGGGRSAPAPATQPKPAPEAAPAPRAPQGIGIPSSPATKSALVGGAGPRREPPVTMPPPPPDADFARQDAEKLNQFLREPRELAQAQESLAQKTTSAGSTTVKVIIPANADPDDVADAINRLYGSTGEGAVQRQLRADESELFRADPYGENTLIVSGSKEQVDRAIAALRGMDTPQGLQQAKKLQDQIQRLEVQTDRTVDLRGHKTVEGVDYSDRTYSGVRRALEAKRAIDPRSGGETRAAPEVRVVVPKNADANQLANALDRITSSAADGRTLPEGEKLRVASDAGSNSLILSGPKDQIDRALKLVNALDSAEHAPEPVRLPPLPGRPETPRAEDETFETVKSRLEQIRREQAQIVAGTPVAAMDERRSAVVTKLETLTQQAATYRRQQAELEARLADAAKKLDGHRYSREVTGLLDKVKAATEDTDKRLAQAQADARDLENTQARQSALQAESDRLRAQLDALQGAPDAGRGGGGGAPGQYLDIGSGNWSIATTWAPGETPTIPPAELQHQETIASLKQQARALRKEQRFNEAVGVLQLIIELDPQDAWAKEWRTELSRFARLLQDQEGRPPGNVLDVEATISTDRGYVRMDIRPSTQPTQNLPAEIRQAAAPWYELLRYPRDGSELTGDRVAPAGRQGSDVPTGQPATQPAGGQQTLTMTYDVRDLIVRVPNFEGPRIDLSGAAATQPTTGPGVLARDEIVTTRPAEEPELRENVRKLVSSAIGEGNVRELNGQFVITADPERQRQVQDLLAGIREAAAPQVQLDAKRLAEQRAQGLNVGGTFLDDAQVDFLINATRSSRGVQTLTAPRITLHGGQQTYVTDLGAAVDSARNNVALQRFIAGNYEWQTNAANVNAGGTLALGGQTVAIPGANTFTGGTAALGTGNVAIPGTNTYEGGWSYNAAIRVVDMSATLWVDANTNQLTAQLGRNLGQKIAVNSTNINIDAPTAERLGVKFITGNNGAVFAVADEAQVRALLELEARNPAKPTDAPANDRIQDTIVGTDALLANGMVVNNPFAADRGNALVLADNTVNLAHEKVLLISNGRYLTAVKTGPIQHWTEAAPETVRFAEVPQTIDVPRVGPPARFEKKLIQPSDQLVIRVKYQWKGDSQ